MYLVLCLLVVAMTLVSGFRFQSPPRRGVSVMMSSLDAPPDLNLAALPTVEEWLSVCDPQLQKVTTAMFRAVKEIAYKVSEKSRLGSMV